MDVLSGLRIDYWYKALTVVGATVLVLALTVPLQLPNAEVARIALGVFLFGLGEWINHPRQESIGYVMGMLGKMSGYPRNVRFGGIVLDALGLALIGWGVWALARS